MKKIFNEVMFRRIMALLLCACMVLPLCMVTSATGTTEPTGSGTVVNTQENQTEQNASATKDTYYVVAGSDFQASNHTASSANVKAILEKIKVDYPTMDGFLFAGDYNQNYFTNAALSREGKQALAATVNEVYSELGSSNNAVYVQGNHDPTELVDDGTLTATGAHDTEGYGVYVLNEDDYMWYTSMDEATVKNTAANLRAYLKSKLKQEYTRPIFIVSHLPLHYSMRTSVNGDCMYANYIFDVLNDAAGKGLNIIFMYGHNHSASWEDSHGGGAVFYEKGDSINIAQASQTTYTAETLNFTYMNAGYVGYYSVGSGNTGVDTTLTMSVFTITEDTVTIGRYTSSGAYSNLKSAGVTNNTYSEPYAVNTKVVSSPKTITLNKEIENAVLGASVTGSGITSVNIIECESVVPSGYNAYQTYDITAEGFTTGNAATVVLPAAQIDGFDPDRPVIVIDHDRNTTMGAQIDGGSVTFTTDHFSLYTLAQADVETYTTTVTGNVDPYGRRVTGTLEVGVPYVITDFNKDWVLTNTPMDKGNHTGLELITDTTSVDYLWYINSSNQIVYGSADSTDYLMIAFKSGTSNGNVTVGTYSDVTTVAIYRWSTSNDGYEIKNTTTDLEYLNRHGGTDTDFVATATSSAWGSYWDFNRLISNATLTVAPSQSSVTTDGTVMMMPTVKIEGMEITDYVITWTSLNESVATVDSNGVVTPKTGGSAYIRAQLTSVEGHDIIKDTYVDIPVSVINVTKNNIIVTGSGDIDNYLYPVSTLEEGVPYIVTNKPDGAVLTNEDAVTYDTYQFPALKLEPLTDNPTHYWYYTPEGLKYGSADATDTYVLYNTNKLEMGAVSAGRPFKYFTLSDDGRSFLLTFEEGDSPRYLHRYGGTTEFEAYPYRSSGDTSRWYFNVYISAEVDFTISYPQTIVKTGKSMNIVPTVHVQGDYVGKSRCTINWSSSNTAVATVDSDGKVNALTPGLVIITGQLTHIDGKALREPINVQACLSVQDAPENTNSINASGSVGNLLTEENATLTPGTPSGPYVIVNKLRGSMLTGKYISYGDTDFVSKYNDVEGLAVLYDQGAKYVWYYDGTYLRYGAPNGSNNYLTHKDNTNKGAVRLGTISDYQFDIIKTTVDAGVSDDAYAYVIGSTNVTASTRQYLQHYGESYHKIASFYYNTHSASYWYFRKAYQNANATLTIFPTGQVLLPGETSALYEWVLLEGQYYKDYNIEWSTSDATVATVDNVGQVTAVNGGEVIITATLTKINGMTLSFPLQVDVPVQVASVTSDSSGMTVTFENDNAMEALTTLTPGSGPFVITNYSTGVQLTGNLVTQNSAYYNGHNSKEGLELLSVLDNTQVWYYDSEGYFRFGNLTDPDNYLIWKDGRVTLGEKSEGEAFTNVVPHNGSIAIGYGDTTSAGYDDNQFLNHYGGGQFNVVYPLSLGKISADEETGEQTLVISYSGSLWNLKQVLPAQEVEFKVSPGLSAMCPGEYENLTTSLTVDGKTITNYSVVWSIEDASIASYNQGKLTAISGGTTTLTAKLVAIDGVSLVSPVALNVPVTVKSVASATINDASGNEISIGQVKQRASSGVTVVEKVGANPLNNIYLNVKYTDGTTQQIPLKVSMLTNADGTRVNTLDVTDESGVQTLTGLNVKFGDYVYEGFTLQVVAPVGDDYPDYPNEGSVQVDKTGSGINFTSTGVAQIELSTTGVPLRTGADVIIMVDTSSSMTKTVAGSTKSRVQIMTESLNNLIKTLQQKDENGQNLDIKVAVADFNNYFGLDPNSFYYIDPDDTLSGSSVWQNYKGTPEVFTGSKKLDASAFVSVHEIGTFTTSQFTGKAGTNYDYAFDAIYELGSAITEYNSESEDRDLFVIFMSDGAPFQFNYISARSTCSYWNNYLVGTLTDSMFAANANKSYYNEDGKHWMAEAIKGNPRLDYDVIRKNDARDTDLDTWISVPGLGATMYSIGYCLAVDNQVTVETMDTVIKNIASNDDFYFEVNNAEELDDAFNVIAGEILYSATNAYFVDTMGEDFDLQMKTFSYDVLDANGKLTGDVVTTNPFIEVRSYAVNTPQDEKDGICTLAQIGDRKTNADGSYIYTVLENVTFNAGGTEAYSNKVDVNGDGVCDTNDNILNGDIIEASTFWYNTGATTVKVTYNGVEIDLLPETFVWKVGTISTKELALNYFVYLTGSMEGDRDAGVYDTNDHAELFYTNYLGHRCSQEVPTPKMPWEQASVAYAFYLVDSNGTPIIDQATGKTGSFKYAVELTQPVYTYFHLNDGATLFSSDLIMATDVLPDGYQLYDAGAGYSVTLNSNGIGSFTINSSMAVQTTYVDGIEANSVSRPDLATGGISHTTSTNNYVTANTVVWFAVTAANYAVPDTVVIDYALNVDVDVLANDVVICNNSTVPYVTSGAEITKSDAYKAALASDSTMTLQKYLKNLGATDTALFTTTSKGGSVSTLTRRNQTTYPGDVRFTLWQTGGWLFKTEEVFVYAAKYSGSLGDAGYYYSTLTVIPATTIYYEDSRVTYKVYQQTGSAAGVDITNREGNTNYVEADHSQYQWAVDGTTDSKIQAQDRPGEFSFEDIDANNIYGYDGAYTEMTQYSLGSAHKFTASLTGDQLIYGEASFSFWGTGFDIISLTSGQTGTITVQVTGTTKDATTGKVHTEALLVDTYYGYQYNSTSGEWEVSKNPTDGTGVDTNALYQVPVIKVSGMPYDKYTVTITVSYNDFFSHGQYADKKYDFYLDAIRIYDPANDGANSDVIKDAYVADGEGWPEYFELRNLIINRDDLDYTTGDVTASGIVFIDGVEKEYDVADYKNFGPNNELYLAPGQSIVFDLNVPGDVAGIHLAMKSVGGTAKAICYDFADIYKTSLTPSEIKTATDLYYDITSMNGKTVVIRNTGTSSDAILSITNIKITYNSEHTDVLENTYFTISGEKVSYILDSFNETDEDTDAPTFPSQSFAVTSASLSLEDEVLVNFYFTLPESVKGTIQEAGLLVWSDKDAATAAIASTTPIELAEQVVKGYTFDPTYNDGQGRYMVQSAGIPAKEMGDEIYYCVYLRRTDGTINISNKLTYSPKTYALNMLAKDSTSDEMKRLCVALLNYGAAAQTYFSYNTSSLMNAELSTDTYSSIVAGLNMEAYDAATMLPNTSVYATASKAGTFGTTLMTEGFSKRSVSVSFKESFSVNYYYTLAEGKEVVGDVTFYYWSHEDYTNATTLTADNATGVSTMILCDDGRYWAHISGIAAKELDEPYYAVGVYSDGTNTYSTGVVAYSVSKYCKTKAASTTSGVKLVGLSEATAVYGYYAKQYFNPTSAS